MMIYDDTSIAFLQRTRLMLREILNELNIPLRDDRFIYSGRLCPIKMVVFEGKELGNFDHEYLQIGLNRSLMYTTKDSVIRDIIRHELAHYLTLMRYGNSVDSHGPEFRSICQECGFGPEVASATLNIDKANEDKEGDTVSERVLERVKKLLRLTKSSNPHESELATLKANEILLRHNIEMIGESREPIYIDRLLPQSRKTPKMSAIYSILSNFVVMTVINKGLGTCCIEVSGSRTNVMLARYVAEFLDRELDRLWNIASKEQGLSGVRSRNSFFIGVARGFNEKMKMSRSVMSESDQRALVVVDRDLKERTSGLYQRLRNTSSSAAVDAKASIIGRRAGGNLTIHQGLESSGGKTLAIEKK